MGIRVWCPIRYWNALYAHGLFEPKVEVASVAKAFLTTRLPITILPKDPVIVVDQETRNLAPGSDFPNLLLDPSQTWAGGCVDKTIWREAISITTKM